MLVLDTAKKHWKNPNAKNESPSDTAAVRSALFCAWSARPASSPSKPDRVLRKPNVPVFYSRFFCQPPSAFLMASSGVTFPSLLAGSQTEIHTVAAETAAVARNTAG